MKLTTRRPSLFTAIMGVACVTGASPVTPDLPSDATLIAIRDVTVIPMTGQPALPHQTVVIENGRVRSIGASSSAVPDGAAVIEGAGRFLFPGLIDAHVHLRRADAAGYVADGVLTVRNMWGHSGIRPLLADIASGSVVGPAAVSLSPGIDGSPAQWPETELLDDAAGAQALVERLASNGWTTFKVYTNLTLASFDATVVAVKRLGLEFAGHVPNAVPIEHALASGMRSIEHLTGYDRRLSTNQSGGTWGWGNTDFAGADALVAATVTHGVWNVPTLAIYVTLAQQHPADMRQRVIANRRRFVRMLSQAGAHLAAGTDAGIDVIPARGSLLAELREFEAAGLSRDQVLATATRHGGELLRQPLLGTIAAGAPARLLLLDADPTKDLAALEQVRAVILDGRVLTQPASCATTPSTTRNSNEAPMRSVPLRIAGVTAGALACSGGSAAAPATSIAGTYATQVSVVSSSSGCTLPVENNPTVVQLSDNNSAITLSHAGTTYGGAYTAGAAFTTQPKIVSANGVNYSIVVSGQITGTTLDATVTLDYGTAPACHVVVRWLGPKQP